MLDQAKWLRGLLRSEDDVCIVDDFDAQWDALETGADTAFGAGEEVYHLLTRSHDEARFAEILSKTHIVWHGVACITAYAPERDEDGEASHDDLRAAAYAATAITCSAYNGEGFVAWRRTAHADRYDRSCGWLRPARGTRL